MMNKTFLPGKQKWENSVFPCTSLATKIIQALLIDFQSKIA